MVLIKDERPVLIDTGFGSDISETLSLIEKSGIQPGDLSLIVNTHFHSDHVGGNYYLQKHYRIPIVAHKWEADLVNHRHPEACTSEWSDQQVEPYHVNELLSDGDVIRTGSRTLQVIHTPGHTLGHISLYEPEEKLLICGDLLQKSDVGWLNIFREGLASAQIAMDSLERIAALPIDRVYPGHGPQIDDPQKAIDGARTRLEKWMQSPEKISWHACKRLFAFALIMYDGIHKDEMESYLLSCGWFQDYARHAFQYEPKDFIPVLLNEMIRSKAASWQGNLLAPNIPYRAPDKEWLDQKIRPRDWSNSYAECTAE
jgi:glyoxylase-like metal-dependent hydrolase (beta-lactamase superfamily II)